MYSGLFSGVCITYFIYVMYFSLSFAFIASVINSCQVIQPIFNCIASFIDETITIGL